MFSTELWHPHLHHLPLSSTLDGIERVSIEEVPEQIPAFLTSREGPAALERSSATVPAMERPGVTQWKVTKWTLGPGTRGTSSTTRWPKATTLSLCEEIQMERDGSTMEMGKNTMEIGEEKTTQWKTQNNTVERGKTRGKPEKTFYNIRLLRVKPPHPCNFPTLKIEVTMPFLVWLSLPLRMPPYFLCG